MLHQKMMSGKTATIIGSSGLIGSWITQFLLEDPFYDYVRILVRKPVAISHSKLEVKLVNFNDTEWLKLCLEGSDAVFSCIGTTNKNVKGDKKLYWNIDHDIPVKVCKLALDTGCQKFIFVSAIGANSQSRNFYLQLKGTTEADIIATGMPQIHIMKPSQLLGERKEHRPVEKFFQNLMGPLSKVMTGTMQKYRAIEGSSVALAMIAASKLNKDGVFQYTYYEMMEVASGK